MGSVRRLRSRPRLPVIATVCVLAGCLIGLSGAGAVLLSKGSGPVNTCVAAKSGAVSVISAKKKCPKGSKSLVIDQVGPQGPQGVRGDPGDPGCRGADRSGALGGRRGSAGDALGVPADGQHRDLDRGV